MECWIAKLYAKALVQRPHDNPAKMYEGLAFVPVAAIRQTSSNVVDSRDQYLGHADIKYGIVQRKGEALRPDIRKQLEERLEDICRASTYVSDPAIASIRWHGKRQTSG